MYLKNKKIVILCSHPHSSALVPWQDNQRRVPSHCPPAGTSRWVSKLAKLFFFIYFYLFIYISVCLYTYRICNMKWRLLQHFFSFMMLHRLFLLRVSQSNPKAFVLTLCHHQKIKHFQILPVRLSLTCYMSRAFVYCCTWWLYCTAFKCLPDLLDHHKSR